MWMFLYPLPQSKKKLQNLIFSLSSGCGYDTLGALTPHTLNHEQDSAH